MFPLVAEKVSVVVGFRFAVDQLQEAEKGFVRKEFQNGVSTWGQGRKKPGKVVEGRLEGVGTTSCYA